MTVIIWIRVPKLLAIERVCKTKLGLVSFLLGVILLLTCLILLAILQVTFMRSTYILERVSKYESVTQFVTVNYKRNL